MSDNDDYEYPRESIEYVFLDRVSVNGEGVNAAQYNLTIGGLRPNPLLWGDLEMVNGRLAFLLPGNLPPGTYTVWVRVAESPELSIIEAGRIILT